MTRSSTAAPPLARACTCLTSRAYAVARVRAIAWTQGAEREALWEELKNFTPVGPPAEGGDEASAPAEAPAAAAPAAEAPAAEPAKAEAPAAEAVPAS